MAIKVPMPPDRGVHGKINTRKPICVPLDGDHDVEIDVNSTGEFFPFPLGYFTPELPVGRKTAHQQLTSTARKAGNVILVYLDNETGHIHITEFEIQPHCA